MGNNKIKKTEGILCRNKQINWVRSWKDDSVVKNAYYSDIEPQFNSSSHSRGLGGSLTLPSEDLTPSSGLHGHPHTGAHTHTWTHTLSQK